MIDDWDDGIDWDGGEDDDLDRSETVSCPSCGVDVYEELNSVRLVASGSRRFILPGRDVRRGGSSWEFWESPRRSWLWRVLSEARWSGGCRGRRTGQRESKSEPGSPVDGALDPDPSLVSFDDLSAK